MRRQRSQEAGTLVLGVVSPRPPRIWVNGVMALDEPLWWRSFQRHLRASCVVPVPAGLRRLHLPVGQIGALPPLRPDPSSTERPAPDPRPEPELEVFRQKPRPRC